MPLKQDRRNRIFIKVHCSPNEKADLAAAAKSVGLTSSSYLRRIGLGYQPAPVIDIKHMMDMGRHVADLGRLGGLLKLWLAQDKPVPGLDQGKVRATIRQILNRIEGNQDQIETTVAKIVNAQVRAAGAALETSADDDDG